jgi:hypothetical protein
MPTPLPSRTALLRRVLLAAFVCGAAVGCRESLGPESIWGDLRVETDRSLYAPGASVIVTTTNSTDRTLYCDHCAGEVQGLELLGEWNGSYGMARGCLRGFAPAAPVAIAPGARHVDTMHINEFAYTGTWRAVLRFTDDAGTEAYHASPSFKVIGSWKP